MDNLRQRSKYANLPWVDLVLLAESEQEKFSDIRFITLSSYYQDLAHQKIIDNLNCRDTKEEKFFKCVEDKAKTLMDSGVVKVKEFVEIDNNLNVTMCINVDSISDDDINSALQLLSDIPVEPDTLIEFGSPVTFNSNEIPTLSM